jgi:hypothetical protein
MDNSIFWIFAAVVVTAIVVGQLFERRRLRLITEVGQRLGWTATEPKSKEFVATIADWSILPRSWGNGSATVAFSFLHDDRRHLFLEYKWRKRQGKNSRTIYYSALFISSSSDIPRFSLRRENFVDRLAGMVGFEDIDLPENPDFSQQYHLQGPHPEAVRSFIRTRLNKKLALQPSAAVESVPGGVLGVRVGKLTPQTLQSELIELRTMIQWLL